MDDLPDGLNIVFDPDLTFKQQLVSCIILLKHFEAAGGKGGLRLFDTTKYSPNELTIAALVEREEAYQTVKQYIDPSVYDHFVRKATSRYPAIEWGNNVPREGIFNLVMGEYRNNVMI